MAEQKKTENQEDSKETQTPPAPKTKREQFRDYIKENHPNDDFDDEEVRYGHVMDAIESNKKMRESDAKMRDLFDKNPQYKDMFMKAAQGEDFITSLIAVFGKDTLLEALNDPEKAKELSEAQKKYIQTQADDKKYKEASDANMLKTAEAFTAFAEKNNLNDDQAKEIWGKCIDIIVNGNNGIMDESLFETVLKAQNYDNAVNEAREEGQIQGRNENIEATLAKSAPEQTPPTFGGGGGAPVKPQEPKKKKQFYNPFAGKMQDVEEEEK